jgi:hypothetical protein
MMMVQEKIEMHDEVRRQGDALADLTLEMLSAELARLAGPPRGPGESDTAAARKKDRFDALLLSMRLGSARRLAESSPFRMELHPTGLLPEQAADLEGIARATLALSRAAHWLGGSAIFWPSGTLEALCVDVERMVRYALLAERQRNASLAATVLEIGSRVEESLQSLGEQTMEAVQQQPGQAHVDSQWIVSFQALEEIATRAIGIAARVEGSTLARFPFPF